MSVLADALGQAQGKALATLQKAYVRGALDAESFSERAAQMGCTDVIDLAQLLIAMDVLKEYGQTEPSYTERRNDSSPTRAQVTLIDRLANEGGFEKPDLTGVTREQASQMIDALKTGTYDPSAFSIPF